MKQMISILIKSFLIFFGFAYYLLLSLNKNSDIDQLKQKCASFALKTMGFKIHIHGVKSENYPKIIIGNHISFLDILVLLVAEPKTVFLSKSEVAKWPLIGWCAKRIGTIFVKRESVQSRANSKNEIHRQLLNRNSQLVIAGFPSGTTSLNELQTNWKKGLFDVAKETQTNIQAFTINYWPKRECAYIDDDNLVMSIFSLLKIKHKQIHFHWLNTQQVQHIENDMTVFKNEVVNSLNKYEQTISS